MPIFNIRLARPDDSDGWRAAARALALNDVPAAAVSWDGGDGTDLFGAAGDAVPRVPAGASLDVPRSFIMLAEKVILHRDRERFSLLYAMLVRLRTHPRAIEDEADPLNRRLELLAKEVGRDLHKMRAFVRFREVTDGEGDRFVAWFEPEHHIVRANAGFFVRRFGTMRWSILTPDLAIHWDGATLTESEGAARTDAPQGDPVEELWKSYYASTFNPARLKVDMMVKEMPRRYWANMPETALIPSLIAGAQAREATMVERSMAGGNVKTAWDGLREEAKDCTRCGLYRCATQTVFGEGPLDADIMFVGEQPGDQEDLAGRPFVGPAGQVFDQALADAGVDRSRAYVTNAVKHFKYEQRGKRRIHARPNAGEISACRWWVDQERRLIKPTRVVMLGTTAIHSQMGRPLTLTSQRDRDLTLPDGSKGYATIHPSFLLRMPDPGRKEEEYARFVADLRKAAP